MTIDDTLRRDLFKSKAKSGDREGSGTKAYDIDLDKHLVSSSKQVSTTSELACPLIHLVDLSCYLLNTATSINLSIQHDVCVCLISL